MTNPNADLRRTRVNKMKDSGHCRGCGGSFGAWFAVQYCNRCTAQMIDAMDDMRRNKPSIVRYFR